MSCRIYELQLDRLRLAAGISPSPNNRTKPLRKCPALRDLIVQFLKHLVVPKYVRISFNSEAIGRCSETSLLPPQAVGGQTHHVKYNFSLPIPLSHATAKKFAWKATCVLARALEMVADFQELVGCCDPSRLYRESFEAFKKSLDLAVDQGLNGGMPL